MPDRNDLKQMSKNDLVREIVKLRGLLSDQLAAAPGTGPEVTVQGIVGLTTREPIVQMRAGEAAWQMTTAQARQHALIILDAAVEAERDAATMAFFAKMDEDKDEPDEQSAAAFLHMMREHRKEWLNDFRSDWGHVGGPS